MKLKFLFILLILNLISSIYAQEKSNQEYFDENDKEVKKVLTEREKEPLLGNSPEENSKLSTKKNNENSGNFGVIGASIGTPTGANINAGYYFKDLVFRVSGMYYQPNWNGIQADLGYSFWKTSVIAHSFSLVLGSYRVRPFDPQVGDGGQNKYEREGIFGYQNQPATLEDQLIRANIANQNPNLALLLEYEFRTRQYANFQQNYLGLTYDILMGNFFLQIGAGYGRGDYRNPQLILQMGYLFDFGRNK
jgi:hypothetical protein